MTILTIQALSKSFGGLHALSDVTVSFASGEFTGLVGPNGSGKTTLLNCISGLYNPEAGAVEFEGKQISGFPRTGSAGWGWGAPFKSPRSSTA